MEMTTAFESALLQGFQGQGTRPQGYQVPLAPCTPASCSPYLYVQIGDLLPGLLN